MLPGKVGGRALYTFKDIPTLSAPTKPRKPTSPRSMTQPHLRITIQTVAQQLLDEVETLRQMRRDLTAEIDSLANQVEGLRRVLGGPLTSQ